MEKIDKNDSRRKSLKPLSYLLPYIKRYRIQVFCALCSLVLAALTTLTLPMAVRRVIDHGFSGGDSTLVNSYFTVLIVIGAILAFASASRYYFVIWLGERIVSDLRKDVFKNVTRLGAIFFDSAHSGEIISRLTADTTQIKSAVGATASVALRNILLSFGALSMMVYTAPWLSLIVIAAIPLIITPIIMFGRAVRKRSRNAQDKLAEATVYATESISAISTVQTFTNEKRVRTVFDEAVDFAFDAIKKAILTRSLLTAFAIFLILSSVVTVLWIGANSVLTGNMTPGTLSQFLLYAVFAAGAFGALSEVWGELTQAAGSTERLVELLTTKPEISIPENPTALPEKTTGKISFEAVEFTYPTRPDKPTLQNFSINVNPGESVAIVGPSGAGKSTLFSLLLRFYDPQSGRLTLEGVPMTELSPETIRKQFAVVPQETAIFATTVLNNISYGSENASHEEIVAAAKAANAHEFIEQLPNGYDTILGERGVTLSGGQRQRLAIARAVLRNAPILLLDEATSALDAESEKLVQEALNNLMEKRTTLIIAHRLATILKADRILVMDQGQLIEEGTHQSLISENGVYAGLAKLQFGEG